MSDPVALAFTWRYRRPLGALAPFFGALGEGRALAARCAVCGRAWFPPRAVCPDHGALEWVELPGTGTVVALTEGTRALPPAGEASPVRLALVHMDGAENAALGPLIGEGAAVVGVRVQLVPPDGPVAHPIQALRFGLVR
ncbi:MAG: Zn-ribbon domain-containing OB-fold protein [Alphaproteobacteria bacterium]